MPQTTYIRRVAARALYMAQLQSRFPKIPGLSTAGFSPPTVQQYRSYSFLVREGNRHG